MYIWYLSKPRRILMAAVIVLLLGLTTTQTGTAAPLQLNAADDFVITVKTSNAGTSNDNEFTIPTLAAGYNYIVDCDNNGGFEVPAQSGDYTCTYGAPGVYTIRIRDAAGGTTGFPRIYFNDGGDKLKLISIDQWGTGKWTSMYHAFYGASNMTMKATDVPDLSLVYSMSYAFGNASAFNGDLSGWDTSSVTNMNHMFSGATVFNQDISGWNTSEVNNMSYMFNNATAFNQDIGGWNTSKVINMSRMFNFAPAFNQDLGAWNVSALMYAPDMFTGVKLSTANYDALLNGWGAQAVQSGVTFDGGNSIYCAGEAARNTLTSAPNNWTISDGGKDCPVELLSNRSFETNVPAVWREGDFLNPSDGPDCGAGNSHAGSCSLVFNGNGNFKRVFSLTPYSANAGDEFTLSIYRKGLNVPDAGHAYANLILFYKDGTTETFILWLHPGDLSQWQEHSITVNAAKNVKRFNLNIFYKKASGTMWVDDISLTRNGGGNLVSDPSFETWKPDNWMLAENFTPDDGAMCGTGLDRTGNCALGFVGDVTTKRLLMRVMQAGTVGDVLNFSIYRKGQNLPVGAGYVNVILVNTDGTQSPNILWLHQGNWSVWEQRVQEIVAAKDYKWITLNIFYKKDTGTLWLDDISLTVQ